MSDPAKIAILVGIVVAAFAAMRLGWRRRTARAGAVVPELPDVPPLRAPRLGPLEATYLSTAVAHDRLARVAVHGLAVRAPAEVEVHDEGVLVRRAGAADLFVRAAAIRAVTRASGMAGTAVGADRVVVLRWTHDDVELDTGLLPRHAGDAGRIVAAVGVLGTGPTGAPGEEGPDVADAEAPTEGSPA